MEKVLVLAIGAIAVWYLARMVWRESHGESSCACGAKSGCGGCKGCPSVDGAAKEGSQ